MSAKINSQMYKMCDLSLKKKNWMSAHRRFGQQSIKCFTDTLDYVERHYPCSPDMYLFKIKNTKVVGRYK